MVTELMSIQEKFSAISVYKIRCQLIQKASANDDIPTPFPHNGNRVVKGCNPELWSFYSI